MTHTKFPVWQQMLKAEVSSGRGMWLKIDQTRVARKSKKVSWKVERKSEDPCTVS